VAVLAIKSEQRCKLCSHVRRTDIDALLERRSNLEEDSAGNRINAVYVIAQLRDWGVVNPTEENLKSHWRKHCEKITGTDVELVQTAALEAVAQMREGSHPDINFDLDMLWKIGVAEIMDRVARGLPSGLSPDLVLKIAAEKGRRQHNETQDELMRTLVGGVGLALSQRQQVELPEVVEDAEVKELA